MTSLELVCDLYRAMRQRDDEAVYRLCAENIIWQQSAGFPGGSTWSGPQQVIEKVFRANAQRWQGFAFTEEEMMEAQEGRRVIVLGHYSGMAPATGKAMRAAVTHVYDVEAGKIARFRMYADTHPMWEALGSSSGSGIS